VSADEAVLIGGGYDLQSSKVQIEKNVQWALDSLASIGVNAKVYFTDGNDANSDVTYFASDEDYTSSFEAMSRVYGYQMADRLRYRSHELKGVQSDASAEAITDNLSQYLSESQQDTLLVFNGHGSASPLAPHQVGLRLWNDSSIQADALQTVISKANKPVRYVFNQCFSGGFNNMIFADPEQGLALSQTEICGFTSESAYQLSEGCSASIDASEYRDYTTYFFAALTGFDRNGEILPVETDLDKDGAVSLREAHLYSIETSVSTDIAHSSSEHYLERWEPWYLKWLPARRALPNNEYAKLFRALTTKYSISLEGNTAKTVRDAMDAAEKSKEELSATLADTTNKKFDLQADIQRTAELKWPALSQPYTSAFKQLMESNLVPQISQWMSEHPSYPLLVSLQDKEAEMRKELLNAERDVTQLEKMLRMRKLAQLKQALYQYGTISEISDYKRVLSCEQGSLSASN